MALDQAHLTSLGKGVTIAVIDSGVDVTHPTLIGSTSVGMDFTGNGGVGSTDNVGHGTGLASLIAGHGRVQGVAPNSTVVPLRIGDVVTASPTSVGQALHWAVGHDIKIAVIASAYEVDDRYLRETVEDAIAHDVVIVASAGNMPRSTGIAYPALYPGVLVVGGTSKAGALSAVSVTGPQVQLVAPSDGLSAAGLHHGYVTATGTSASAALVAGAAALIRSKYPQLSAKDVIKALTSTAIDKGAPGRDDEYGYGLIDIPAALAAAGKMSTAPSTPAQTKVATPATPASRVPVWLIVAVAAVLIAAILLVTFRRARSR